jgi:hypothetical protein
MFWAREIEKVKQSNTIPSQTRLPITFQITFTKYSFIKLIYHIDPAKIAHVTGSELLIIWFNHSGKE